MQTVERILSDFRSRQHRYQAFHDIIAGDLAVILRDAAIEPYSISSRIKSIEAIRTKLEATGQMRLPDDIVGVRVVCYYREDVSAAAEVIANYFKTDNVAARLLDTHPYSSIHLLLRPFRGRLTQFADLSAECQICTVVQQAHAEIEHALGYKADESMRKPAARIAALAELYEDEVSRLRAELVERNLRGDKKSIVARVNHEEVHTQVETLCSIFRQLLHDSSREEELQGFLKAHPELLYPEYVVSHPKMKLGDDWVTDFVLRVNGADGAEYVFVEIERPDKSVFVGSGQFSAEFTQAKDQLLNWERWVERNVAYLREKLPDLYRPQFHLVMGRSVEMSAERCDKLKSEFVGTRRRSSTYDDILVRFETIAARLRSV